MITKKVSKRDMLKRIFIFAIALMCACSQKDTSMPEVGYLSLNINPAAVAGDLDIFDFNLRIINGDVVVLDEKIADLPEEINLLAGIYTIEAYSINFSDPKFETPLYFGSTIVRIESGKTTSASLICALANAGVKVVWMEDFSILYNNYQARIDCATDGYLIYSSSEARIGYFLPGEISITISADGTIIDGGVLNLEARDMVTLIMHPKETASGGLIIDITIDYTTNDREVNIIVDPENTINSQSNPYTIDEAIKRQNENDVWITGYIVGVKPLTNSDYNFWDIDKWRTNNIVIADDISETDSYKVIFVELPNRVAWRNINLLDHPDNLHKKILIRGNLRSYYTRAGIRAIIGDPVFID
jgi:hypothetical protein